MNRKHAKLLRQAISREQRRPQHGYCDAPVCARCRAIDAWGPMPLDRYPECAVCRSYHAMDAACVGVGNA